MTLKFHWFLPTNGGDGRHVVGGGHGVNPGQAGRPADVELLPLYALHHQRFTVYWKLVGPARWAAMETAFAARETARRREEARVIDAVRFGEQQSERDHDVRGEASDAGEAKGGIFYEHEY